MPSQQEVRWSQLKIGIIVLVSSVILVTLLFLMSSNSGLGILSKKLTVITYFENAAGLKNGGAVNLQGVTIGSVKSVAITGDPARRLTPVRVVMKIDSKYQDELREDSKAALTTGFRCAPDTVPMTRSHLWSRSVLRTKPTTCGNQT